MGIRAVLDTNVVIARFRSSSPTSPGDEIFRRWQRSEFIFLYQEDILDEYIEVLLRQGISSAVVTQFITILRGLGEFVPIDFVHFDPYPSDPDDIVFLLCGLNGGGSHLVTYDDHLLELRGDHPIDICTPVDFLRVLRKSDV